MSARYVAGAIAGITGVAILVYFITQSDLSGFLFVADVARDENNVLSEIVKKESPPLSRVEFSEILVNPEGSDVGKEFITLVNRGERDVDLKGWLIQRAQSGGAQTTLVKIGSQSVDTTLIRANGRIAIGFNRNTTGDMTRSVALQNSPATFFLVDSEGEVRDEVVVSIVEEGVILRR